MDAYEVPVVLIVEDDGPDEARALVQAILESAGGSDAHGYGEFGFVLDATPLREAIERIQRMRDEAEVGRKRVVVEGVLGWKVREGATVEEQSRTDAEVEAAYSDEMYSDDFDGPWDSYDAYALSVESFDRVLDVLQALAHGLTPEQGSTLRQDISELDRAADRGEPPYEGGQR